MILSLLRHNAVGFLQFRDELGEAERWTRLPRLVLCRIDVDAMWGLPSFYSASFRAFNPRPP